jgi:phospholipid/cholesterol/gamma-HCH transport system substrate-binding protein
MNENSIKNLIAGLFVIFMVFVMIFFSYLFSGGFNKTETTTYVTNFKTIAGLNPGADVSYKGLSVGKVNDIYINKKDPELISVEMDIESDIQIFKQTVATLQSVGITGQSNVELSFKLKKGQKELTVIPKSKNSIQVIPSVPSTLTSIIKKVNTMATSLEEISEKLNTMLSPHNMLKFDELTNNTNDLIYNLNNSALYFNKTLMSLDTNLTQSEITLSRFSDLLTKLEYDPSILVRGIQH